MVSYLGLINVPWAIVFWVRTGAFQFSDESSTTFINHRPGWVAENNSLYHLICQQISPCSLGLSEAK